ncbi:MAG: thiamine pyrophosphate-dependent enzyme [Bacillota bacterium]|uniref:2-oxoglutarate oxidoreductase n=1 Tax=Thermanaerosceptrum fracticalcis TaxID=1712410 RepID=A0A7G6E3H3_THEFR|nr:thiamine pyrophosphate-dependent enzyme [Thermanaerosceptrum fracticalcis]QNB46627.1 2-oxoglutarate oxidoreductase [Thermanaerosceptrum fracticalcis]
MAVVFERPKSLIQQKFHYCPGCHHGIIHRLVAEVLDELELQEKTIAIASVGCSVFAYDYFDVDAIQAAHGRAPAVATGVKRSRPESIVFTYQGDGDLASIGAAEIIHAAARGENITVIFVNNAIYGMTGGQMAPTTLIGQETTTSPQGRNPKSAGYPIRMSEMLATLPGVTYIARTSVHDPKHVRETKKAIKEAFQVQVEGKGFSLVEVLSACPTNWHMTPVEALDWIKKEMIAYYPLGKFKSAEEAK